MATGGYKIVSLRNKNLTVGSSVTIPGIYEEIEGNYRKAILLSGVIIDNVEKADRFVTFGVDNGDYVAVMSIAGSATALLTITITSEDVVTITEN